MKAVIYTCVPGFSCYVLLTKDDGVDITGAQGLCQDIGAHLVRWVVHFCFVDLKNVGKGELLNDFTVWVYTYVIYATNNT